jgi:hypothetical protein
MHWLCELQRYWRQLSRLNDADIKQHRLVSPMVPPALRRGHCPYAERDRVGCMGQPGSVPEQRGGRMHKQAVTSPRRVKDSRSQLAFTLKRSSELGETAPGRTRRKGKDGAAAWASSCMAYGVRHVSIGQGFENGNSRSKKQGTRPGITRCWTGAAGSGFLWLMLS